MQNRSLEERVQHASSSPTDNQISFLPLNSSDAYRLVLSPVDQYVYYVREKKPVFTYPRPHIFLVNAYVMGEGILGMALPYHQTIFILEGMKGPDFDKVSDHEHHHLNFPWHSELATQEATGTTNFTPHPYVSYIG